MYKMLLFFGWTWYNRAIPSLEKNMDKQKKYPICEELHQYGNKYCAALVITKNFITDAQGKLQLAQPSKELRNGTITFVSSDKKT